MKKILIITLILFSLTACKKEAFEINEQQTEQSDKAIKSGGVNILFKSTGTMITVYKLILVEQLDRTEIYGYTNCDDMILIKKSGDYQRALILLEDITISGYYIIE
jgi:hypothetical protein